MCCLIRTTYKNIVDRWITSINETRKTYFESKIILSLILSIKES